MQQDVVGLQRGIRFQFTTPVAVFMLFGKEEGAGAVNRSNDTAGQIIDLAETCLWNSRRGRRGRGLVHISFHLFCGGCRWSAGDRFYDLRRQTKPHILGHHFHFLDVLKPFTAQELHNFFH